MTPVHESDLREEEEDDDVADTYNHATTRLIRPSSTGQVNNKYKVKSKDKEDEDPEHSKHMQMCLWDTLIRNFVD